ncbi:MAG: DUF3098 domain-containing protein [Prevotella sp.]|nr:DUF3098 domain-containing protein [Prevotella sp.]MBR6192056.1 DUF3098 domain-containing protein [Prevotella sp.]
MENKDFAFSKTNFMLIGVSMLIVVVGFLMMIGASSNETQFDADIFSAMRTKVAPVVCFIGFVSIVGGIMYHKKNKE